MANSETFTSDRTVTSGNPTKALDHNELADNTDYLEEALATIMNPSLADGILRIADSKQIYLGTGLDYWWIYNAASTQLELWSTDVDGAGADGAVIVINDGTNDVQMAGGLAVDGAVAPTSGIAVGASKVLINDTADTDITVGLCIQQGAADNYVLTFKSSDVAHPMTAIMEADSFGGIKKNSATGGGLRLYGMEDSDGNPPIALSLMGYLGEAADTTKTTGGFGAVRVSTGVTDAGTGYQAVGLNGNLFTIDDGAFTRFIFDAEGSGHADVEWTTYDALEDAVAVRDFEQVMLGQFGESMIYHQADFERLGIIGQGSVHMENGKVRGMVNFTRLAMLHHGAIMQGTDERQQLRDEVAFQRIRIEEAYRKLARLEAN